MSCLVLVFDCERLDNHQFVVLPAAAICYSAQIPDGKAPQKKLKAPSMSQRSMHMNGKPEVVIEADEEVMTV